MPCWSHGTREYGEGEEVSSKTRALQHSKEVGEKPVEAGPRKPRAESSQQEIVVSSLDRF